MQYALEPATNGRFRQSRYHISGSQSHHQIGAFYGQFAPFYPWLDWLNLCGKTGLNGRTGIGLDSVELSSWDFPLDKATTDEGALALAREILGQVNAAGIPTIASIATHLQGQVLGDTPSAVTLQFQGGEPVEAYKEWRKTNSPPTNDPFFVPDEVGAVMLKKAAEDLRASGRLAYFLSKLQGRRVPLTGFTGAPARLWHYGVYQFPGIPNEIGGVKLFPNGQNGDNGLANLIDYAYELFLERFGPILTFLDDFKNREDEEWAIRDTYQGDDPKQNGLNFEHSFAHGEPVVIGFEDHPTEIVDGSPVAMETFVSKVREKGGHQNAGVNYDASHKLWNNVDPIAYIHEFGELIYGWHFKGVNNKGGRYTRAGLLGAYQAMAAPTKSMHFVYALSDRDQTGPESIIVAMNQNGFEGAVTIECEDNDFELGDCLRVGAKRVREIDLRPTAGAFDKFAGGE